MKKILFIALLLLSLMVCLTSPAWAGGSDDVKAGSAAAAGGDYDKAIRLFTKAIESGELSGENLSGVYYYRGNAWYGKGDYDKAIADYTKAIEIEPKAAFAYINRGYAWEKKGNYDKGIADLTKAIEINPMFADAYFNRAYAWYGKGDYDKAIADLTKAIEINPKHAIAYSNRGNVWEKKRNYDKAVVDYTKAIEIDPKFSVAYNNLVWLMATCPDGRFRDGKRAVELAEKAVALGDAGSILDTLAAAYAEAGRFQEAIKTQERVITKCKKAGETKDLPEYEEQLSSYKAGKPWRDK